MSNYKTYQERCQKCGKPYVYVGVAPEYPNTAGEEPYCTCHKQNITPSMICVAIGTGIYDPSLVHYSNHKTEYTKTCSLCGHKYVGNNYYCDECMKFCEENENVHDI